MSSPRASGAITVGVMEVVPQVYVDLRMVRPRVETTVNSWICCTGGAGCILRFERLAAFVLSNPEGHPMARVPASEATRKRLQDMLAGKQEVERGSLVREAVRLIVEQAREAEVSEAAGRGYYDRAHAGERRH